MNGYFLRKISQRGNHIKTTWSDNFNFPGIRIKLKIGAAVITTQLCGTGINTANLPCLRLGTDNTKRIR